MRFYSALKRFLCVFFLRRSEQFISQQTKKIHYIILCNSQHAVCFAFITTKKHIIVYIIYKQRKLKPISTAKEKRVKCAIVVVGYRAFFRHACMCWNINRPSYTPSRRAQIMARRGRATRTTMRADALVTWGKRIGNRRCDMARYIYRVYSIVYSASEG